MSPPQSKGAGARHDYRTGQYVPTVNGVDTSPTTFDKERALQIAQEQIVVARLGLLAGKRSKTNQPTVHTMKQISLTERQVEFLYDTFFKGPSLPGAPAMARRLLSTGSCIVAGDGRIWSGGVGNFIKTENATEAVGCTMLRFDLPVFLSSMSAQDAIEAAAAKASEAVEEAQAYSDAVQGLLKSSTQQEARQQ